jgi:hypothetical protein
MSLFDLDRALIVGVQKDSPHELKEFEYHKNQELIDAIYDKWHRTSEYIVAGELPPEGEIIPLPLKGVSS